jgi:nifR3 family TIM-barrel protein
MSKSPIKTSFAYGKLLLPHNLFYAPLAGCSDYPFRMMSGLHGQPGLMYCEMVKMDPLVRRNQQTLEMLRYHAQMRPIGGQVCGSRVDLAAESARIIEELGFDTLDLNCGCPVDKVTKDGSGSALLKDPKKIGDILHEMVRAVRIPVTLKIRAGWDEGSINVEQIVETAEAAGAVAITVHGRTRAQGYHGPAIWEYIRRAKSAAKKILVIGNGDIHTGQDVIRMYHETGCDGFLFARATMGAPWVAQDALQYIRSVEQGDRPPEEDRTIRFFIEAFLEHLGWIEREQDPVRGVLDLRRVGAWYIKGLPGARHFRGTITRVTSYEEARQLLADLQNQLIQEGFDLDRPYATTDGREEMDG